MLAEQAKTEKKLEKVKREEQAKDKEARISAEFLEEEKREEAKFNGIMKLKQEEALADRLPPRTLRLEIFTPFKPTHKLSIPAISKDAPERWHQLRKAMLKSPANVLRVGAVSALLADGTVGEKVPPEIVEYLVDTMLYANLPLATLAYENLIRIALGGTEAPGNLADLIYLLGLSRKPRGGHSGWLPTPARVKQVLQSFRYSIADAATLTGTGDTTKKKADTLIEMHVQQKNLALYLQAVGFHLRNRLCEGWTNSEAIREVLQLLFLLMLDSRTGNSSSVVSAAVCIEAVIANLPDSAFDAPFYESCAKAFGSVVDFAATKVIYEETGVDRDALDDELSRHALSLSLLERLCASDQRNKILRAYYAEQLCLSHDLIPTVAEKRSSGMLSKVQLVLEECEEENSVANHAFEAVAKALDALEADVRRVHEDARDANNQRKLVSRDYHRWVLFLRTIGFVERLVISKENRYRKKHMHVVTELYQMLQRAFEKKFHLAFTHLQDKITTLQSMYLPFNESRSALRTKKKGRQMLLKGFTKQNNAQAVQVNTG